MQAGLTEAIVALALCTALVRPQELGRGPMWPLSVLLAQGQVCTLLPAGGSAQWWGEGSPGLGQVHAEPGESCSPCRRAASAAVPDVVCSA